MNIHTVIDIRTVKGTTMTERASDSAQSDLLQLMTILSPSFPVGGFSYSHGIEWAVETGDVSSQATLVGWITDILQAGAGWSDAVLLAHAYRAVQTSDENALGELVDLGLALQPSAERYLEASMQGRAFTQALTAGWPFAEPDRWMEPLALRAPYAVAIGIGGARLKIALPQLLAAALHAIAANLVSAGVRLVPLGQSDGVRAMRALEPIIADLAVRAKSADMEALGGFAPRIDIASLKHETQYTRLFRS